MRVLIADDNLDTADSLATLLQLWGHDVRVAYDGNSAVQIAHHFQPHIALLDPQIRRNHGPDLTENLRSEVEQVRIIATCAPETLPVRECSRFDAVLSKPCNLNRLEALLSECLLDGTE